MSHITNATAILDEARLLMEQRNQLLTKATSAAEPDRFPLAMLLAGFRLGGATTAAVKVLLASGDELLLPAISCCRAFFELSLRLHWASREEYGWYRLYAWFVGEQRKWATFAKPIPQLTQYAEEILRTTQSFAGQKAKDGTEIRVAPRSLEDILKDLEKHKEDEVFEREYPPGFDYNVVYRQLCQYAHGHIGVILDGRPGRFRDWAVLVPLKATLAMVQAYHRTVDDPDHGLNLDTARLLDALVRNSSA